MGSELTEKIRIALDDTLHDISVVPEDREDNALDVIVKLWEDTEVEIIEQYQDCLDKHHVQLAEMREQVAIHSANAGELAWLLEDIKRSWWDKHYPPDIFVGGGHSDAGVNEIVRIREAIEEALSVAPKEKLE